MLGDKRTTPLWRQRRPQFLPLERSLAVNRPEEGGSRSTVAERRIKGVRARGRMIAESKMKGRFSED